MRLFVAAYPPDEALEDLAGTVSRLAVTRLRGDGVNTRVVPRERWHVTVVFLGEIETERVADVAAALAEATGRWSGAGGVPPRVRFGGGGRFGRGRSAILWVGLRGDTGPMADLAAAVTRGLRRARIPFDAKPWRAHMTLARPGDRMPGEALRADTEILDGYDGPVWTVPELCLVESELGPAPVHRVVDRFPLEIPASAG